jgi:hypothetical protein
MTRESSDRINMSNLHGEVEIAKRAVNTDTVQISLGEVAAMYAAKELNILPDFQRLFRWSPEKKSAFIESILIGIPIPPVFAYEKDDGTWELIDGLQRISTVLEFMGILRDPDNSDVTKKPSTLLKTKYLPSLDGMRWEETEDQQAPAFEKSMQLFFRRARIDFQVLKYPSDPKTKYDLFQRLNRGGAYANEQEVRSCAMVLANPALTSRIREIASGHPAKTIFRITNEQVKMQKDIELVVRSIVLTDSDFRPDSDVQDFIDKAIIEILADNDLNNAIDAVAWTIDKLERLKGGGALLPGNDNSDLANRFSLRALEGIVVGIASNKSIICSMTDSDAFINERIDGFWAQPEIETMSASGLRGTTRLQRSVPFGKRWFKPDEEA